MPGYWRTENARVDPALARLARLVRPFPDAKALEPAEVAHDCKT
jgi:hypothetical protein